MAVKPADAFESLVQRVENAIDSQLLHGFAASALFVEWAHVLPEVVTLEIKKRYQRAGWMVGVKTIGGALNGYATQFELVPAAKL